MEDEPAIAPLFWAKARPRIAHAKQMGDALMKSMSDWNKSQPMHADIRLAPDQMGFQFVFDHFDPEPPLDDWAVQFAAIAHQYRVILDNAIEELARIAKLPKNRQRHFPIVAKSSGWKRELKGLEGFPPRIIDLLYGMQPFVHHRGDRDAGDHVLSVLAWTDNNDKHDDILTLAFLADRFDSVAVAQLDDPTVDFYEVATETKSLDFTHGRALLEVRTEPYKITNLERADVWMQVEPAALDHAGTQTFIPEALNEFLQMTLETLVQLNGVWDDPATDTKKFAGATDRLQGAAFGRSAVDSIHGDGTWDSDYLHSPAYQAREASHHLERSFDRMKRTDTLPDAAADA